LLTPAYGGLVCSISRLEKMKSAGALHLAISSDTLDFLQGLYVLRQVGPFMWANLDGEKGSKCEYQVALTKKDYQTLRSKMETEGSLGPLRRTDFQGRGKVGSHTFCE
jgi:hypothetical protein